MVPVSSKNGQIIWTEVLKKALKAVRLGRQTLLSYYGRLQNIENKELAGLVSEADRESERIISQHLKLINPDWEFLGEEESFLKGQDSFPPPKSKGRWILDPLDGTTNYVHQFPIFCISLGFEYEGVLQLAIIDVPLLNETYTAIRGEGAFLNGKQIFASRTETLKDSLLATGFFAENKPVLDEQIAVFSELVKECRGIRRAGAAAYDLCMVAKGSFDGFWEPNLKPWDVAAGQLLVEEAGGIVLNKKGEKHSPYDTYIMASNKSISRLLVGKIRSQSKP